MGLQLPKRPGGSLMRPPNDLLPVSRNDVLVRHEPPQLSPSPHAAKDISRQNVELSRGRIATHPQTRAPLVRDQWFNVGRLPARPPESTPRQAGHYVIQSFAGRENC